jgi:hypothetical protein
VITRPELEKVLLARELCLDVKRVERHCSSLRPRVQAMPLNLAPAKNRDPRCCNPRRHQHVTERHYLSLRCLCCLHSSNLSSALPRSTLYLALSLQQSRSEPKYHPSHSSSSKHRDSVGCLFLYNSTHALSCFRKCSLMLMCDAPRLGRQGWIRGS